MRVARTALCLAVAGSLLGAGVAGAASKPKPKPKPLICNLMTGQPGAGQTKTGADPQLDILSADLGSDAKNFTAVLRMSSLSATDTNTPGGRNYYVQFNAPGQANVMYVSAGIDPVQDALPAVSLPVYGSVKPPTFDYGSLVPQAGGSSLYTSAGKGDATGKIDYTAHTITINVPVPSWASLAKMTPGVKLTAIEADATYIVGVAGSGNVQKGDTITAAKPFVLGTPSCVVPGKIS